jgi:hypothetical protein
MPPPQTCGRHRPHSIDPKKNEKMGRRIQDGQQTRGRIQIEIQYPDKTARSHQPGVAIESLEKQNPSTLSRGSLLPDGMTADNTDQPIELKAFCCKIINDHEALRREEEGYKDLPIIRKVIQRCCWIIICRSRRR